MNDTIPPNIIEITKPILKNVSNVLTLSYVGFIKLPKEKYSTKKNNIDNTNPTFNRLLVKIDLQIFSALFTLLLAVAIGSIALVLAVVIVSSDFPVPVKARARSLIKLDFPPGN